jgi:hypothetical protein
MTVIQRFLGVIVLLLSGCSAMVDLSPEARDSLHKGMEGAQVAKLLGNVVPLRQYRFESDGRLLEARHISLNYSTKRSIAIYCTSALCIPDVSGIATVQWIFVFDDVTKKLAAWGTFDDISRNPDAEIRALAGDLKVAYVESLAKN